MTGYLGALIEHFARGDVRVAGDLARLGAGVGPDLAGLSVRLIAQSHKLLAARVKQPLGVLTRLLRGERGLLARGTQKTR